MSKNKANYNNLFVFSGNSDQNESPSDNTADNIGHLLGGRSEECGLGLG